MLFACDAIRLSSVAIKSIKKKFTGNASINAKLPSLLENKIMIILQNFQR